jgi:hypothetical protein
MKNKTFLAATLLLAALTTGRAFAQENNTQALLPTTLTNAAAVSTINVHAIKDFKTRFSTISNEQWSRMDKGYCVYFTKDGFKVRAYYDKRGSWRASLKYCDESQLPHFIRDIVKRTYYDLAITFVNIVEVPDHTVYLVHLEDKNTLKVVRVTDEGEMDTLQDNIKIP